LYPLSEVWDDGVTNPEESNEGEFYKVGFSVTYSSIKGFLVSVVSWGWSVPVAVASVFSKMSGMVSKSLDFERTKGGCRVVIGVVAWVGEWDTSADEFWKIINYWSFLS